MSRKLTFKKLVLKFHENKNFILYYFTNELLLDNKDFNAIKKIPSKKCEEFLSNLKYSGNNDANICIFCHLYSDEFNKCPKCPYSKNHGYCCLNYTPYSKISSKLSDDISSEPLIEELVEETCLKYLKIKINV